MFLIPSSQSRSAESSTEMESASSGGIAPARTLLGCGYGSPQRAGARCVALRTSGRTSLVSVWLGGLSSDK
jgi:hypothetical protein